MGELVYLRPEHEDRRTARAQQQLKESLYVFAEEKLHLPPDSRTCAELDFEPDYLNFGQSLQ